LYVEAILGLLLLLVWAQNFSNRAVAWWGSADLVRSLSIALYGLYGAAPDIVTIDLATALLFTSFGLTWTGARAFEGRAPLPGSLAAGAIAWLVACQFPAFTEAESLRTLLSSLIIASFSFATAYEFWRGREERLVSRWPTILILACHGVLFLLRTPLSARLHAGASNNGPLSSGWITVLSPEALLFTIAIAFVLLAMAKERTEHRHKTAALVDALTGVANRRAFMDNAQQLVRRQVRRNRPVAVFLIDIDAFKQVNDSYGHATGDRLLRLLAQICVAHVRASDVVGRIGGDEFAVLLADANRDNAFLVADRIRNAFAEAAATMQGQPMETSVSIGVAIIQDPDEDLAMLLGSADKALYRAKGDGRNRVQLCHLPTLGATAVEAEAVGATLVPADSEAPIAA
ncbi:MAG: GGDEF domain-containing protein, partial [Rhizobiales bacterium]|nr:GGDEF domain-containing protein [Hyphomicrobiales bacterium]